VKLTKLIAGLSCYLFHLSVALRTLLPHSEFSADAHYCYGADLFQVCLIYVSFHLKRKRRHPIVP